MTAKERVKRHVHSEPDSGGKTVSAKERVKQKAKETINPPAKSEDYMLGKSMLGRLSMGEATPELTRQIGETVMRRDTAISAPVGAADTYTRAEEGKRLKAERDKAEQELYTSGGQREYEDRLRAADAEWQSWWNANPDLHDKIGEKLTVGENLDYLAGRALKGFGGAVQGTIGFVDKLVGDDLAILGSLVDATTGGKTQIEKPIQKWADNALEADILGAEKFGQGVEGSIAGAKPSAARDFIGGISESAGAMLPAIATGGAASAAGLGAGTTQALNYLVFGSGAAGNAAKEAINNGASADEAVQYGLYSGMLEVLSESMFAGITGMNPSGALDDILKRLKDNGTIKFLTDTIGEGVEEGIVTFLTPYIARATYNPQAASATWKEMMQAISSGAAMSLLMNSAVAITSGSPEALISSTKGMNEQQVLQDKYGRVEEETVADVFRNGSVTPAQKPAAPAQEEVKEPTAKERLLAAVEADKVKAKADKAKEAEEEIPRMELKGIEDETESDTQPAVQSAPSAKPAPTGTATERQRMQARAIGDMVEAGAAAKTSPAALGIENGGDIESITVLEEPLTKMFDFSEASEIAERAGYEPVYFSGMLQNSNGGTSRWGIAGNKLYIQADSANYTAADIAKEAVETGSMPAAPVEAEIKPAKRPRKTISIYDGGIDSEDQYTKEYIASGRISESDLQTISETAKALGLKVRFANSLVGGKVGAQIENGIVTISASSSKPLRRLFGHEITHRLQELAPAAYNQMRSIIQNSADSKTKVRRIIETYEAQDLSISELDALDEVVADYAGSLLEDEGALEQLISKGDKTLLEKLREVFRALADKLMGRQKTQAERVYEKLAEAMENASGRVSNYQTNGGKKVSPDINPGFAEARFSVEPPYRKGTKEGERFLNELDSKASKTYQLFDNIHTIGEENMVEITVGAGKSAHPKKVNITMQYMLASKWNDYCDSNPEFAETAEMLAGLLPDAVKKNANIRDDGRIEETPFEAEFKMERAFIQRIVDALPMEVINSTVISDGQDIKVSNKNKVLSIGGEAYRRALVEERRSMYRKGKLPTKTIATLSKDNWGAMGFLATNGKTGASGDFTTLCPQMYFNKGCFYCYRRAALTSGVNNKLTGETVWYTGEILQLTQSDVEMLNKNGGLRIQSFGDWMEQYSAQLADLLMDAEEVGLQIKIITKEPSMIETVALLKEQGIGNNLYFNLSADYVIEEQGEINNRDSDGALPRNPDRPFMKRDGKTYWKRALTVEEAAEYRSKYDWVNTRIVATTLDEFIEGLRSPYVDVVTGYHGSLREYERVSSATGETLVDVEPLGDAGMPRFAFIRGKWQLEYEGKTKTHKKLAQAIEDAGLQWEYYIKSCCITGRCATCKGKCGKLANIFGVKNATNRDAESLAYWQEQMDSAADNPLLVSQMENTSGVKYSLEDNPHYTNRVNFSIEGADAEREHVLAEREEARQRPVEPAEPAATADEVVERKIAEAKAEAAEENAPELLAEKMSNSRGEFSGSAALEKLGIKVVNSIGKYSNVKQLLGNARAGRSITRERKKAEIRLKVTAKEKNFARGIANGIYTESDIPEGWDKRTVMEMSEWYMAERNFGESYIDLLKQAITVDVDAATAQMFEGADESKVPPAIVLNHRTAQRNMLNIFGDKGKEINKWLFDPVNQNEAERIRFINRQFDQVRTFADQTGKQRALNKAEREMVQRVIEGRVVEDALAKLENRKDIETAADSLRKGEDIGDIGLEFGLTLEEQEIVESLVKWQDVQDQLEAMDKVIIYNAVDKYSALFDSYYEAINDFLAAHGYQPIGFIKGYVPHLQPEENQTALQNVFQKLGLNTDVSSLPTSIAGLTGDYKPNKKWNPYFLHRNSTVTQFDIVEAFESYVSNMADVLYHADDIMRIRSAVKYFRRTYSPEEIRNSIEWAENLRTMPKDEKISFLYDEGIITSGAGLSHADAKDMLNKYIEEQYGKIENTSKFNNLVTYLENYANILAGKQSIADRGSEYSLGRKILNAGNKLTRIFSRANVAGNFSSALNQSAQLPTILSENGLRNTSAAFKDIITGNLRKAGWAEDSDFLTGKRGVSFIVTTPGEMVIDAFFKPLEIVDSLMSTMAVRGAYLDGIKQGMSHEAAMQYADKKAASIMGDRTKGAKPLAFEAKNPISSMVHLFQVEALNSWDHIASDLPQDFRTIAAVQGKKKAVQALAGVLSKMLVYSFVLNRLAEKLYGGTPAPFDVFGLTANFIASGQELSTNAYLESLIDKVMLELFGMELFGSDEDERMQLSDGEFEWEAAVEDLGYNISNEFPFLNNLSALLGLGDKTLPLPDLITPMEGVYEGIKNKSVTEALDSALQLVGEIVPAGRQVVKTYTGAKMIAQGGKMKGFGEDARLQYPVRRTAGNVAQAILFGASGLQENQDFYASGRTALTTKETALWKTLVANGADEEDAYDAIYSTKGEDVKTYEKLLMMAAPLEWSNGLKYDAMAGVTSDSFGYKLSVLENNDIDAAEYAEVTAEMYDIAAARIAKLPEDDRPETVTISQEDAEKALKASNLSKQEKAIIWQMTNAGWSEKSNPFSNSIGKRVKAEYKEIKEQAEEEKRKEEEEDEIPRMELRGLD